MWGNYIEVAGKYRNWGTQSWKKKKDTKPCCNKGNKSRLSVCDEWRMSMTSRKTLTEASVTRIRTKLYTPGLKASRSGFQQPHYNNYGHSLLLHFWRLSRGKKGHRKTWKFVARPCARLLLAWQTVEISEAAWANAANVPCLWSHYTGIESPRKLSINSVAGLQSTKWFPT